MNSLLPRLFSFFLLVQVLCSLRASAQIDGLFHDPVYAAYERLGDIQYGSAYNYQRNEQENLLLDIYEPNVATDYLRPVLIYVHGGGFTAGDKYNFNQVPTICGYFAQRGWITSSINYRLGIENPRTTDDNYEEVYESTQDAKAAVRFFRAHAAEYCVDTSAIFITGASAGASIAMQVAYWDQDEANPYVDEQKLGPLENGSGNPGYSSKPRAVISCWGGTNDTAWLNNNNVPQYLFHGTDDPTVPYTSGYNDNHIYIYGSYDIHEAALRYGIESYLHPFWGFGHGIPDTSPEFDTLLMESNDFLYAHLPTGTLAQTSCSRVSPPPPPDSQIGLQPYPNPSNGEFDVSNTSGADAFNGTFSLYDVAGQLIYSKHVTIDPSSSFHINMNFLQSGVYFSEFNNGTQIVKTKMIIIH